MTGARPRRRLADRGAGPASAATGRSAGRTWSPAAGRSSSPTTTTRTSTTRPRSCWRSKRVQHPGPASASTGRSTAARDWLEGMQSSRRRAGARSTPTTSRALVRDLPFCDFGEVIDPPSADVTAHALEMLAALGRGDSPAARRGLELAARRAGARRVVVRALGGQSRLRHGRRRPGAHRGRVPIRGPRIRRAVRWLEEHQNDDGGWGEDVRSYDDPAWIGRGASTASQTAWALLALHAAGEDSDAVRRGMRLAGRRRSVRTAVGTSPSSPAPASPPTSTSTTTCTASCSRSWRWGAVRDDRAPPHRARRRAHSRRR